MMNPFKEVNWNPGPVERRKFALSLLIGFPCVAVLLLLAGRWHTGVWNVKPPLLIGGLGTALGLLLLVVPFIARPFYVVWYALGCSVGIVVGNVLFGLIFYIFITGIGLLRRSTGHPMIQKGVDRQAASYWKNAEQPADPNKYYRQF